MVSLIKSWFDPGAHPVGVDLGRSKLRLAQVDHTDGEFRLAAAASAEVPRDLGEDFSARSEFYAQALRGLWERGNFRGRKAVLSFPADLIHVQHLRLPRMDPALIAKAIPWEIRGKLPFDSDDAVLRHVVAGEVYRDGNVYDEIILMAARQSQVSQILSAARSAHLDVVGMTVQPRAILDCFLNIYRRKTDAGAVNGFIDIGCQTTRVVVTRGMEILFVRHIPIGAATVTDPPENEKSLSQLVEELALCRGYHDSTFPDKRIGRLIFVGGAAHDRALCLQIARALSLEATIGDPLVRLGRTTKVGIESGIDRRTPQPSWAMAIGLSMGAPQAALQRKLAS